ncbi:MAG: hypothetical protein ACREYA_23915 [Cupriavidus necator]
MRIRSGFVKKGLSSTRRTARRQVNREVEASSDQRRDRFRANWFDGWQVAGIYGSYPGR